MGAALKIRDDLGPSALRDAVLRYNAEGLCGLHDRPKGRPPRRLSAAEEAALAAVILEGPDPGAGRCLRLDQSRPLRLVGGAFRQDLSSLQHDPGAAAHGLLAAEGATSQPQALCRSASALQKRGCATR